MSSVCPLPAHDALYTILNFVVIREQPLPIKAFCVLIVVSYLAPVGVIVRLAEINFIIKFRWWSLRFSNLSCDCWQVTVMVHIFRELLRLRVSYLCAPFCATSVTFFFLYEEPVISCEDPVRELAVRCGSTEDTGLMLSGRMFLLLLVALNHAMYLVGAFHVMWWSYTSKSKSLYDWQLVSLSVLVSSPVWG
jgi:hypothetical protein